MNILNPNKIKDYIKDLNDLSLDNLTLLKILIENTIAHRIHTISQTLDTVNNDLKLESKQLDKLINPIT